MTTASNNGWRRWSPPVAALVAFGAVAMYALGPMLGTAAHDLPGNDSVNLYAWESFTRATLADWRLPLWNPYLLGGTPHLADTQTTVLYPIALMLRWLPAIPFLAWMVAVHLLIAGAGALFLSRVIGLGWLAATATALATMIGGNAGPWLHNGHLLLIYTTAWLPWALGLSVLSVRRAGVMPSPALVVVLVLQFLAGYLQGNLYIVAAVCLYFLFSAVWPEEPRTGLARWRPLMQLAVLGALTLGVGAFQVFPTARLTAAAGRTAGLAYEMAIDGAWPVRDLGRFFFPFQGVEGAPPYRYLADGAVYVGWLLTALVPCAFLHRDRRLAVFFGVLSLGAVAFAMGDHLPFYQLHYALLPGLRVPGRLLFLATLGLAVLGGIGLERFIGLCQRQDWRPLRVPIGVAAIAIAGATVAALSTPRPEGVPFFAGWPWVPAVPLIGLAVAAVAARAQRSTLALIVALTVVAADLVPLFASAVRVVSVDSVDEIRLALGPPKSGRAISVCEHRIDVKAMLANRQASLDGIGGMYLRDFADWAQLAKSGDQASPTDPFGRVSSDGQFPARRDLMNQANVTVVFSCGALQTPSLRLVKVTGPVSIYESVSARPRAVWTCGAEELLRSDVTQILRETRYDEDGRLVRRHTVHVRWAPGVTDEDRMAREQRYQLLEGVQQEGRTWRYAWGDVSAANGVALINDAAVEDTHGLDRGTGAFVEPPAVIRTGAGAGELLIGLSDCPDRGEVVVGEQDQVDGRVTVDVNAPVSGFVFLSEPYFAERRAFVDGREVRARKANLAFTAVPVPAGRHHVELRLVPRSLQAGLGTSAATLVGWFGLTFRRRGGR